MEEEAVAATSGTRTYAEAKHFSKKDPRQPARGYYSLLANLTTYCILLRTLFGKKSSAYKGTWAVRRTMKQLEQKQSDFSAMYCKQITWAILDDSRQYFNTILTMDDFLEYQRTGDVEDIEFPTSCLLYTSDAADE